jgi:hypothetical protein
MPENGPGWISQEEHEKIAMRINQLMNERRASKGGKAIRLTSKELSAIDEVAQELASERARKTTGARTYKIHMNGGTPVSFEVVHEKSVKRPLN